MDPIQRRPVQSPHASLDAQYRLGKTLLGRGDANSLMLGEKYIKSSADEGHLGAKFEYGLILIEDKLAPAYQGYAFLMNPTPEEREAIIRTGLTYIEDSAAQGYSEAKDWLIKNRSSYI